MAQPGAHEFDYSMHCWPTAIGIGSCPARQFVDIGMESCCAEASLLVQGTCAKVTIADLVPSPSEPLLHPDMMSYTTYLGAFQNSSTRAGPNALAFQGCPGICSKLESA